MVNLTPRQQTVYDLILASCRDRGYPPTLREIGDAMGIKSLNGVACHLKPLEKKGLIVREANRARAIQLCSVPRQAGACRARASAGSQRGAAGHEGAC